MLTKEEMLTREEITKLNCDNLRMYASKVGVKKIRTFKKAELIEEVLKVQSEIVSDDSVPEKTELETEEIKNEKVEVLDEEKRMEDKIKYIEGAEIGTIVAFKPDVGKVKSAKIIKRSIKNRKLKVETAYGTQYIISFDDVLWVKTSNRWPRGVFRLLKGLDDGERKDKAAVN